METAGSTIIARSACGIPSFELTTGSKNSTSHQNSSAGVPEKNARLRIMRQSTSKSPDANNMPTGQTSCAAPAMLCRQLPSPRNQNIPAVFAALSLSAARGDWAAKTEIWLVRPKKSAGCPAKYKSNGAAATSAKNTNKTNVHGKHPPEALLFFRAH